MGSLWAHTGTIGCIELILVSFLRHYGTVLKYLHRPTQYRYQEISSTNWLPSNKQGLIVHSVFKVSGPIMSQHASNLRLVNN